MPGRPNTVSVTIAPPISSAKVRPSTVTTGISALRSAWCSTTRRSDTPLARAVRMWSSPSTSSMLARVKRRISAELTTPSTIAGRTR